jgi:spore germination protein YaaH
MIAITKITVDEVRDERTLFGVGIYSFDKVDISVWNDDLKTVIEFAKANKCKFISTWVVNEKASSLLKSIGFKHRFDVLMLDLNGGA